MCCAYFGEGFVQEDKFADRKKLGKPGEVPEV